MRRLARRHAGAIAVAVLVLAVAAQAAADTWTLRLKRRQSNPTSFDRESYVYWSTYPQYFQMQIGPPNSPVRYETPDQAAFKRLVERAKVARIRLHDLRDTHASLLAKAGVPIEVVSQRLGHSCIGVTVDRYRLVELTRHALKSGQEDDHHRTDVPQVHQNQRR